ncbi:Delta(24)-sterol reductase [Frankliniella fusca]|uniref:Delta(24)-sterol reductase n=1 Tax=Frankliniella fusca TaxID=407009 RepID=A0AAE1GX55_9NEOP|nr:Delta(24)-sterol reductase [Frankliniella fusca]
MAVQKAAAASSSGFDAVVEHILIHYRWAFVILLLPISLVYDVLLYVRSWVVFQLSSAPHKHGSKVENVAKQVRQWRAEGARQPMCTARPSWQTMSFRRAKYKKTMFAVNVNLVDILDLNTERRTVRVEPLVTMGQLTATLDPLGWTLPFVPELDDLTVGGLVMGTGVETSSHKYGLFQHICVAYELVLADGSIVQVTKESDPDLFYSVPWSYGTLGFLTAVEIKIVPALRFVKLQYEPVRSLEEADTVLRKHLDHPEENEFIEALMFSKDEGVVMTGNMVSCADWGKLNEIGRCHKPWFFEHVRSFLRSGPGFEYIPLRDYQHRHTRSFFWEMKEIIPFGNNPLFRYLFGWMTPPKVSLLKLTQTQAVKKLYESNHIIQDMLVPIEKFKESVLFFDKEVAVYPLWLCPFRLPSEPGMLRVPKDAMYLDIGVYGVPTRKDFDPKETTRRIEAFVAKAKGFQMLYADTYTTRDEFRQMFDHSLYDKMRARLKCEKAFPEVYDKVCRKARD